MDGITIGDRFFSPSDLHRALSGGESMPVWMLSEADHSARLARYEEINASGRGNNPDSPPRG